MALFSHFRPPFQKNPGYAPVGQPLPSDMQEQDEDPPHPQFQEDQDDKPLEDHDN